MRNFAENSVERLRKTLIKKTAFSESKDKTKLIHFFSTPADPETRQLKPRKTVFIHIFNTAYYYNYLTATAIWSAEKILKNEWRRTGPAKPVRERKSI